MQYWPGFRGNTIILCTTDLLIPVFAQYLSPHLCLSMIHLSKESEEKCEMHLDCSLYVLSLHSWVCWLYRWVWSKTAAFCYEFLKKWTQQLGNGRCIWLDHWLVFLSACRDKRVVSCPEECLHQPSESQIFINSIDVCNNFVSCIFSFIANHQIRL